MPPRAPVVIGYHLILTGYGHWLPNDPRGSGSDYVHSDALRELGPIHCGRKRVQPSREELRTFLRGAEQRLQYPVFWFDDAKRQAVALGVAEVIRRNRYTCYACAILQNHFHALIRRHRDDSEIMCDQLAQSTSDELRRQFAELRGHPIWGRGDYKLFKDMVEQMWNAVHYIEGNPQQSGLPPQKWDFVTPYDGWPHARQKR